MNPQTPAAQPDDGPSRIPASLEAFFSIADAWSLSTEEQIILLGSPGRSTFFKWKKDGGSLPSDTLERISYIFGIYKALEILLPNPDSADEWIKKPNEFFDNKSALEYMLEGIFNVYRVRQYVDAQRGG